MRQVIYMFHIFGHQVPIYGYGLMLVVAILVCMQVAQWMARHSKIDPELFVNAALIALITGVIGARMSHVLENFGEYTSSKNTAGQNLFNMINISSGGLTFYGGFVLATPCCIWYALKHKMPLLKSMDIVAPVLVIGLGIGRIGCFLNGCCYGAPTTTSLGVRFPYYSNPYLDQFDDALTHRSASGDVLVVPEELLTRGNNYVALKKPDELRRLDALHGNHDLENLAAQQRSLPVLPAQLMSTVTALMIAGILICHFTLPHAPGQTFAIMLMIEGISRYTLELLRVEPPVVGSLSLSMVLGIIFATMGIPLWFFFRWYDRRGDNSGGVEIHRPRTA